MSGPPRSGPTMMPRRSHGVLPHRCNVSSRQFCSVVLPSVGGRQLNGETGWPSGPASAKGPESFRRGEKSAESARTGPYHGLSDALTTAETRAHARMSRIATENALNRGLRGGAQSIRTLRRLCDVVSHARALKVFSSPRASLKHQFLPPEGLDVCPESSNVCGSPG